MCALLVAVFSVLAGFGCSAGSGDDPTTAGAAGTNSASTEPDAGSPDSVASGWVASNTTSAWFINLIQADEGALTGTTNLAQLASDGQNLLQIDGPITGTLDGNNVVIEGLDQTWSGEFDGDTLRISFASPVTGELIDAVLTRGDAADYNVAIRRLNDLISDNRAAAAAAQAAEQDAQAVAQAEAAAAEAAAADQRATAAAAAELDRLTDLVEADTDSLRSELEVRDPIPTMQQSFDAIAPYIDELDRVDCIDAEFAAFDLTYAADTLLYDASSAKYDADTVRSVVDLLKQSVGQLEAVAGPTDSHAQRALDDAQAAIDDGIAQADSWDQSSAALQRDAVGRTQAALSRGVNRCDILTTWEPQLIE